METLKLNTTLLECTQKEKASTRIYPRQPNYCARHQIRGTWMHRSCSVYSMYMETASLKIRSKEQGSLTLQHRPEMILPCTIWAHYMRLAGELKKISRQLCNGSKRQRVPDFLFMRRN